MTSVFAAALAACGLSPTEAARVLGLSRSTVHKKSSGVLPMTSADVAALSGLYGLIRAGRVAGFPAGVQAAAAAQRLLRGIDVIAPTPKGRPRGSRNRPKPPPSRPWPPHPYSATPPIPLASLYTDPLLKRSAEAIDEFLSGIDTEIPGD